MINFSAEDLAFIKILAKSESSALEKLMDDKTKVRFYSQIVPILREYQKENTLGTKTDWVNEFKKYGITEDEGKAAIACARRLGMDII